MHQYLCDVNELVDIKISIRSAQFSHSEEEATEINTLAYQNRCCIESMSFINGLILKRFLVLN